MHFVIGPDGYAVGCSGMPHAVNGIHSIERDNPEGFDDAWLCCYRDADGILVLDETKKAALIAEEAMPPPLTETELLRAQVQALTDREEFMEDVIAELAMMVL